jgi:GWxTD domain-containing protein
MILVFLMLMNILPMDIEYYRFENSYVEIWYQIPVRQIFCENELSATTQDSMFIKYTYCFEIFNRATNDSAYMEGNKGAFINPQNKDEYFIDYIPVYLYSGDFNYQFMIDAGGDTLLSEGELKIPCDTVMFTGSDLLLGRKDIKSGFMCHGCTFTPSVTGTFSNLDTLFSYLEIYGLIPDSLYYNIKYQIFDSLHNITLEKNETRLKYDYVQIDTFSVYCGDFLEGEHKLLVEIYDSAQNTSISCNEKFKILSLFDQTAAMKFYDEIQYLVNPDEYKKFCALTDHNRNIYLKKFWSKTDYWQFEKKLVEADEKFSTRLLKGRDSERGKLYIKNGAPNDIEIITMIEWGRQLELWHYYSKGKEILFCDLKNDGNPQLIAILRTGELTHILEFGYRDPEKDKKWPWLFDIAPGTYEGQKSIEEKKERLNERRDQGG